MAVTSHAVMQEIEQQAPLATTRRRRHKKNHTTADTEIRERADKEKRALEKLEKVEYRNVRKRILEAEINKQVITAEALLYKAGISETKGVSQVGILFGLLEEAKTGSFRRGILDTLLKAESNKTVIIAETKTSLSIKDILGDLFKAEINKQVIIAEALLSRAGALEAQGLSRKRILHSLLKEAKRVSFSREVLGALLELKAKTGVSRADILETLLNAENNRAPSRQRLFALNTLLNNTITSVVFETPRSTTSSVQKTKKSITFYDFPEKYNSYIFKCNMLNDKLNEFFSSCKDIENSHLSLYETLSLINNGNLIISEINFIIENNFPTTKEENNNLLIYKNIIIEHTEGAKINLAHKLFNEIYISSEKMEETLSICIIILGNYLKYGKINTDLHDTLLTNIASVANEYSGRDNSLSGSNDSFDAETPVSTASTSEGLTKKEDEKAVKQLYDRFFAIFKDPENTFTHCKTALAKQLTQAQITPETHEARLAIIREMASQPIPPTTNVYGTLFVRPSSRILSFSASAEEDNSSMAPLRPSRSNSLSTLSLSNSKLYEKQTSTASSNDSYISVPAPSCP